MMSFTLKFKLDNLYLTQSICMRIYNLHNQYESSMYVQLHSIRIIIIVIIIFYNPFRSMLMICTCEEHRKLESESLRWIQFALLEPFALETCVTFIGYSNWGASDYWELNSSLSTWRCLLNDTNYCSITSTLLEIIMEKKFCIFPFLWPSFFLRIKIQHVFI